MKRLVSLACLAMLASCGGGGGGSGGGGGFIPMAAPVAEVAPVERDCTVELNGDSIMHGESDGNGTMLKSVPASTLKGLRPAYTVTDKAVGGQTSTERAAQFNNDNRTSRIIVIQHGVNDMYRGDVDSMEVALKSMTTYAQAEGRKVVITGMSVIDAPKWKSFADRVKKVADDTGSVYADWTTVQGSQADGVHPDQAFSNELVGKLAVALDQIAPECAKP